MLFVFIFFIPGPLLLSGNTRLISQVFAYITLQIPIMSLQSPRRSPSRYLAERTTQQLNIAADDTSMTTRLLAVGALTKDNHTANYDDLIHEDLPPSNAPGVDSFPMSTKSTFYMALVPMTAISPLIGLVVWLSCASEGRAQIFSSFTGAKIGGHLTQTQAKTIDFVCSALLAPTVMAILNWIWFQCTRICVVNEITRPGVPLRSLAVASTVSGGNYDIFNYYTLLQARTWRFSVLVLIVLLSAVGTSALSVSSVTCSSTIAFHTP